MLEHSLEVGSILGFWPYPKLIQIFVDGLGSKGLCFLGLKRNVPHRVWNTKKTHFGGFGVALRSI